jgi:outer membrane lipoprotein SlyB
VHRDPADGGITLAARFQAAGSANSSRGAGLKHADPFPPEIAALGCGAMGFEESEKDMKRIYILLFVSMLLSACASSNSGSVYTRDQARQTMNVTHGRVLQVRAVQIEGTKSPVGAIAGGATGAALGSAIGSGTGKTIAIVVGGLAGAAGGAVAEEQLTRANGLEITVLLQNGQQIAVVQEADEQFYVGESVDVLTAPNGTTRIRH